MLLLLLLLLFASAASAAVAHTAGLHMAAPENIMYVYVRCSSANAVVL